MEAVVQLSPHYLGNAGCKAGRSVGRVGPQRIAGFLKRDNNGFRPDAFGEPFIEYD